MNRKRKKMKSIINKTWWRTMGVFLIITSTFPLPSSSDSCNKIFKSVKCFDERVTKSLVDEIYSQRGL